MLNGKKLRRHHPLHKDPGAAPGYVLPEEPVRRRTGPFVSATPITAFKTLS